MVSNGRKIYHLKMFFLNYWVLWFSIALFALLVWKRSYCFHFAFFYSTASPMYFQVSWCWVWKSIKSSDYHLEDQLIKKKCLVIIYTCNKQNQVKEVALPKSRPAKTDCLIRKIAWFYHPLSWWHFVFSSPPKTDAHGAHPKQDVKEAGMRMDVIALASGAITSLIFL